MCVCVCVCARVRECVCVCVCACAPITAGIERRGGDISEQVGQIGKPVVLGEFLKMASAALRVPGAGRGGTGGEGSGKGAHSHMDRW